MTGVDGSELVTLWAEYAKHAAVLAEQRKQDGDWYGADLAAARGEVRLAAAEMLRQFDPAHAAKVMYANAVRCSQRDMPLDAEADQVGVDYTRARTWKACARAVDPSLSEVQARWT